MGFPGESEDAFQDTLNLIDYISPVKVHAFGFSMRPGTKASLLLGSLPEKKSKERVRILIDLSEKAMMSNMEKAVGGIEEVLIEGNSRGYTRGYLPVIYPGAIKSGFYDMIIRGVEDKRLTASCI